jgi:hypothetical protein
LKAQARVLCFSSVQLRDESLNHQADVWQVHVSFRKTKQIDTGGTLNHTGSLSFSGRIRTETFTATSSPGAEAVTADAATGAAAAILNSFHEYQQPHY